MNLPELTIAPDRGTATQSNNATPYGLQRFPSDWFDDAGSVGSLRHRLTQGALYGMQDWLDYDAPVGSMRNSPAYGQVLMDSTDGETGKKEGYPRNFAAWGGQAFRLTCL